MDIDIVRQPPRVMLQLAQHPAPEYFVPASTPAPGNERDAADAPPADPPPPGISVVIVEPPQQSHIPELRHALATYYPQVRCYRYDAHGPEGQPRLEAFDLAPALASTQAADASGLAPSHPSAESAAAPTPGPHPRLRDVVVKAPDRPAAHDAPLVSEEELTMLLGPDQPAPTPRPHDAAGSEGE